MFLPSEAHAYARFQRALEHANLWGAEDAAREMGQLSLEDAFKLVHLYAEVGSPKFEPAAMRWLRRYLDERSPTLQAFAKAVLRLAHRQDI